MGLDAVTKKITPEKDQRQNPGACQNAKQKIDNYYGRTALPLDFKNMSAFRSFPD